MFKHTIKFCFNQTKVFIAIFLLPDMTRTDVYVSGILTGTLNKYSSVFIRLSDILIVTCQCSPIQHYLTSFIVITNSPSYFFCEIIHTFSLPDYFSYEET